MERMRMLCLGRLLGLVGFVLLMPSAASAQETNPAPSAGIAVSEGERLRFNVRFMGGYGNDESQYGIGNESQGRIGYAILELSGKISDHFSYRFEFNPVNEVQPLPSCGEQDFFYPNVPQAFGPEVVCDPDGRTRVDDYRYTALDVLPQQGPIRQAFLDYRNASGSVQGRFGRFILPIGFNWEDAGSYTSKDATHIQRINAEANFGFMLTLRKSIVTFNLAAYLGEGNRFHDYDYFYSLDSSLDMNSSMSGLASATFQFTPGLEARIAQKSGFSGSKVEYLPNFYASKRIDRATVASARYRPTKHTALFGEYAWYRWGLTETSAELIGWSDTEPVTKNGYYLGADGSIPLTTSSRVGATFTHERLDRDDALIKHLTLQNLYNVRMGEEELANVFRVYVDLGRRVRAAAYVTLLDNPFPWVSGIWRVEGPSAFTGPRGSNKWGLVARFSLD
jgi:hypothetical protein